MALTSDFRWIGSHGIGRFAKEVLQGLQTDAVQCAGRPSDPLDPFRLTVALRQGRAGDAFFSPGYNAPLAYRGEFFLTIHDLNHIDRTENGGLLKSLYYSRVLKPACYRAAKILTVSEFSKARIVDWSGVDAAKVVNVGNGVDKAFNTDAHPEQPGYQYFLCVGNRKGHKNELRVVRALARLGNKSIRLVFTGTASVELSAHIAQAGLSDRIVFSGRTDDHQLASLYAGARALIFPSLYEGFGLPVVEAFACGTPVITSNSTSLPEIAGGAALLVDPENDDEIVGAMESVLVDSELRARLRAAGVARASAFTWEGVVGRVRSALGSGFALESSPD